MSELFRMSDSESSSSEEEDVPQFSKNAHVDFFATLTALKNNDPRYEFIENLSA